MSEMHTLTICLPLARRWSLHELSIRVALHVLMQCIAKCGEHTRAEQVQRNKMKESEQEEEREKEKKLHENTYVWLMFVRQILRILN